MEGHGFITPQFSDTLESTLWGESKPCEHTLVRPRYYVNQRFFISFQFVWCAWLCVCVKNIVQIRRLQIKHEVLAWSLSGRHALTLSQLTPEL